MKNVTTNGSEQKRRTPDENIPRTLGELAALGGDELGRLYANGTVPSDLGRLVGRPKGRMLAVRPATGKRAFEALRYLSGRAEFPWDGKSFAEATAKEGTGINRVKLGPLRFEWFPFRTRIEPSVLDGAPCIYLDYEQPGNPFFIAKIRDEIREIHPGLFLGPAMWKTESGAAHVLWFAVDFNHRSEA
jgi:hypothetical protein